MDMGADQIVRVMEDWISMTYMMILWSRRCSAITSPSAGFIILFLKISKKGRLKRHLQMRSFCRDYHYTVSTGSSSLTFRYRQNASASMARERK